MKTQITDQDLELPGGVTGRIVSFDDGAIRLILDNGPYVLQECVIGDPVEPITVVTLSPGQQGSAAQTGKIKVAIDD